MKRIATALSIVTLSITACSSITGCSSSADKATEQGPADCRSTATDSTASTGDTLNLARTDGARVAVSLTEVLDPVSVAGGSHDPNARYLATKLTITNCGAEAIEGAVNVNASIVGTDDRRYIADLDDDATECTNFDSGIYHLKPEESTTGCVVFALPTGVMAAKMMYTPSEGFASESGEWLIS